MKVEDRSKSTVVEKLYSVRDIATATGRSVAVVYSASKRYGILPDRIGKFRKLLFSKSKLQLLIRVLSTLNNLKYLQRDATKFNTEIHDTFALVPVHHGARVEQRLEYWEEVQGPYFDRIINDDTRESLILRLYLGVGGIGFITVPSIAEIVGAFGGAVTVLIQTMRKNIKMRNVYTERQLAALSFEVSRSDYETPKLKRLEEFDELQSPTFSNFMNREDLSKRDLRARSIFQEYFAVASGGKFISLVKIGANHNVSLQRIRQIIDRYSYVLVWQHRLEGGENESRN